MESKELFKILSLYLPYDIKIQWNDTKDIYGIGFDSETDYTNNLYPLSTLKYVFDSKQDLGFKFLLKPLSMLTQEIEHDGERFVPIERFEIGDDINDSEEYDHGNIKLIKTLERISKFNLSNDMLYLPHGVVQKIIEWKFDIKNLIELGYAIDESTLTVKH